MNYYSSRNWHVHRTYSKMVQMSDIPVCTFYIWVLKCLVLDEIGMLENLSHNIYCLLNCGHCNWLINAKDQSKGSWFLTILSCPETHNWPISKNIAID